MGVFVMAEPCEDVVDLLAACALIRMDEKGESLDAAIEAVTGDRPDSSLGLAIAAMLRGEVAR